ncbi:MAG: hypothetical protein KIT16_04065, partial [Rhodospirillaceae bacterium]|nr:hypothetical protein [Rhodospirillaceae bacterium]
GYMVQRDDADSSRPAAVAAKPGETKNAAAPVAPMPTESALARSRAAAPEKFWERTTVKNSQDVVRGIFMLGNGQLLVAGGRIDGEGNNSDAWLWRLDAKTGEPVSARKSIPSARLDSGNAVFLLSDGAVALAAARRNPANGAFVAWVARLSQDGDVQWEQTFLDRKLTVPYAVTALSNGDLVVVGTATADEKTGPQGWAARISADGKTVLWNKLFGKGGDDSLQAVRALPDGGLIAVGWTSVERPAGEDRNLWVVNIDADGNMRWEKKDLGDEADEKGKAVFVAADGDILVLAESSRAPAQTNPENEATEGGVAVNKPWLLRLTGDGTVRWETRDFGGNAERSDTLDAIVPAGDGGFFIAGATESKGAGRKDAWLVRIDSGGKVLWDAIFGDRFDDEFTAVAPLLDGGVVVGGGTASLIEMAAKPQQPPQAEAKLWLMRLGYK